MEDERKCLSCEKTEEEVSFTFADDGECECCDECYLEQKDYEETASNRGRHE